MHARAPLVFAFVLGLAFLLLLLTFRSIVIPLKAIALNLLSVGAAYGVLVWIFQHGHLAGRCSASTRTAAIVTWLPLFLFTVLFGLSMDYHVFILSRIKELVDRGVPTEEAVERGIRTTAGTVTSAALVMVAVFAIFATLVDARHQADGRRPRGRGAARRDDHPRRAAAGDDEAARRLELVPAALARLAAAAAASRRSRPAAGGRLRRALEPLARQRPTGRCSSCSSALPLGALGLAVLIAGWTLRAVLAITPLVVPAARRLPAPPSAGARAARGGARRDAARRTGASAAHALAGGRRLLARGPERRSPTGVLAPAGVPRSCARRSAAALAIAELSLLAASLGLLVALPVCYRWTDAELGSWRIDTLGRALALFRVGRRRARGLALPAPRARRRASASLVERLLGGPTTSPARAPPSSRRAGRGARAVHARDAVGVADLAARR